MMGPQASMLPDGRRLHLHHGPIDLIIEAFGAEREIKAAYKQARHAFRTVLSDLVCELTGLCGSNVEAYTHMTGAVARRMAGAVSPHSDVFVTPMAAVAGAVADHVLHAMIEGREVERAYVNNGGDCALHLERGCSFNLGALAGKAFGTIHVRSKDDVRGVATSGWRGRSHSLGIADAVTVLAGTAAEADVAATLIGNAVDLPKHPAITRVPARELNPDSDLGERLVTTDVGPLTKREIKAALDRGLAVADEIKRRGLLADALLVLNDETRATAPLRILEDA